MSDHLNINNIDSVSDPATQRILLEMSAEMKERDAEMEALKIRLSKLESKVTRQMEMGDNASSLAVYGNTITELPHGVNKAIAECVLPALLESLGMSSNQSQSAVSTLVAQTQAGIKPPSQRHPVWATPNQMRKQFEDRVNLMLEKGDADNDGFISRQEFKQIIVDHFRYRVEAQEGEALHPKDLSRLEKRAYKLFKKFDKDNNKKLDIDELRNYFHKQIIEDDEEDIIEQALFL
ncbi:uncharacterized protein LOC134851699 [Symsagittifera roscoffensis]|uniref:uncharacterized protein LOC134851699 n=1 Tax=Symsagittifera roscoffensis TaxID=84072 RepID=UPI00307B2603